MPLIQNPTPARKLQRSLRLTELPDSVLAPEIVGVVIVEDLSDPLSFESRGCAGMATVAGVAGENGLVSLVRVGAPAAYDAVCTAIWFHSLGTASFRILGVGGSGTLTVSPQTVFTDFSVPGRPTSQVGFDTQVGSPSTRIMWEYRGLANTTMRIPTNIRLGTVGDGLDFVSLTVALLSANVQFTAGFEWTESAPLG